MKKYICTTLAVLLLLLPQVAGAEFYYFHDDHLGGSSVVTDQDGDVTAVYDYMPYGETYIEEVYDPDFDNSYKFTDQEEDSETGLYYYGARYYNPSVGGFYSQDPAVYDERLLENLQNPQALNSYSYVLNNPVKYTDPSGEMPKGAWAMIAKGLRFGGYDNSADLLFTAITGEGLDDDGVLRIHEGSTVTADIRKSDEYKEAVMNVIYSDIDNGVFDGIFDDEEITFEQGDLSTAFHGMKGGGNWHAVQRQDGHFDIYIKMTDLYDFDYDENPAWYIPLVWGNNEAYMDQMEGDLNIYNIEIYMQESYDPSGEDE